MINAVILAGGLGTRLQSLHPDVPKALAPVAGRPFIAWLADALLEQGIRHIHVAAGYRAAQLRDWVRESAPRDATVTLSEEPTPLGTGGAIRHVAELMQTDPFLALNGDTLLPFFDLKGALEAHRRAAALATLVVVRVEDAGRFGTVEFDEGRLVTEFREKAPGLAGWVNGGIYIMQHEAVERIDGGRPVSIERDVFPSFAREHRLAVWPADPPLLDMGTPEGLADMERFLKARSGG
jgi:NDP-sugar pyrophosphorylase family protein